MSVAERVIRKFNNANGKQFRVSSWENRINKLIDQYGEDILFEVIGSTSAEDPAEILNPSYIKSFLALKETGKVAAEQQKRHEEEVESLKAEIEKSKKIKLEEEQSNMSLGLVEKALARVMIDEYAPVLADAVFRNAKDMIEKEYGKIVKKVEYQIPQTGGAVSGVTHEEFETVLQFVMADEPVMLIGPAGTGKNVMCKQIAEAMNLDFYFSNAVTQEYKLTGFIDANGTYHETEFYKAFKDGGLFMLDEIDASIPEVLVILNAAIANRYFDFPVGKIKANENFRVIAAGNTFGLGASYQYVGRNQLDAASLDRFAQIEINYSPRIEETLTADKDLISFIRTFRKECNDNGINHVVSYRTISRLDKVSSVMPIKKALQTCLLKNMEQDDLKMIIRSFKSNGTKWERGLWECVSNGTKWEEELW